MESHPLSSDELVQVVIGAWDDIFASSIGTNAYSIGQDIFPAPQIMAFLIHELVPMHLQDRYPGVWRGQQDKNDKDIVHMPDDRYSIEIKASSSSTRIFGNRS